KITKLRFKFTEKRQQAFELPLGWPDDTIQKLKDLGFTEKDMATLAQLYTHPQVKEAMSRMAVSEARLKARGEVIQSREAFF
ncbi:hypothetical protein Q6296_28475, partial [Klebsiella variicola]